MIKHTIRLQGPKARGARISLPVIAAFSDALVEAAQRTLRLQVEGRSHLQGKADWLDAATEIEFVGLSEGSTVMHFEAPTLGEAAPKLFDQAALWENGPRSGQSAFSLAEDALRDSISGNADSDRLDRNVLEAITRFKRVLGFGYDEIVFGVRGSTVSVTTDGLARAERLRADAPPAQKVIVSGLLDELKGSKRAFTLLLGTKQTVRGLLPSGAPEAYARFFHQRVVVDGEANFRPSGALSLVVASHIQEAAPSDAAWENLPRPRPRTIDDLMPRRKAPSGTNGMELVFGRWPGDETDEQVLAALEEVE